MKAIVLVIFISILTFLSIEEQTKEQSGISNPDSDLPKLNCPSPPYFSEILKNETNKNETASETNDVSGSWYRQAMEQIEKEEYNISYCEETRSCQSPNRANNIRFVYHNDGFTAMTRTNKIPKFDVNDRTLREEDKEYDIIDKWSVKLKVENTRLNAESEKLQASGNKAWIENDLLRIDYTNTKVGMRQDFTIKKKPEGEGKLRLNLSAETKLKMIAGADALTFMNDKNEEKMKYSSLKVWDANGNELIACFEKSNSGNGNTKSFSIIVNDEDAVYPVTIDPLSTSPDWTDLHDQANSNYGTSVATAGDVNGDGYSDVITSAPYFDNGQTDEGRVWVFLGSANGLSGSSHWRAEPNQDSANFGWSVATAGDVNGDGYSDVIIGAYRYDSGQNNEGKVFAWYGSASGLGANGTPANADWSAESDLSDAQFGWSVSTAGDVNGDGYSDVIIGAIFYQNGQSNEGRAFVYHGSSSGLSASANWIAESNQAGAQFGYSVSSAGDVNGDGYSDLIIGARMYQNGQSNEGRAYVYHGSSSGLSASANWTAESNQSGAQFGFSVSTAGDVNGDGYSDVIAGAQNYNNGQANEGRVFLYKGSAGGLSVTENWTAECDQAEAKLGYSVSSAGDVNGDGYSDIIAGAPFYDSTITNEGRAFMWYGSTSGLGANGTKGNAGWTFVSGQDSAQFGISVFTAGDVNGDGFSDIIAGANLFDDGQNNEGKAYLFNGSPSGLSAVSGWDAIGEEAGAELGYSVSSAGDVNADGYSDVIIGAPLFDLGQTDIGKVFVYLGSQSGLPVSENWSASNNINLSNFGYSVSTAGDVNGDGYSDVIVGSFNNYLNRGGRAYVYHGTSNGAMLLAWTGEIFQSLARFGYSVSTAGDVNGDGYSDVIVGAPYYVNGETTEGRAFVFNGSEIGLSNLAGWFAEGNQSGANFGISVSAAGDVNGDGYSDVIVGAWSYDNGQTDEGRSYVYHGSASGLSATANWTAESDQASAYFGVDVSTAGDVNGDGYSDVLVGADFFSNGQLNEGKAFAYYGSASGLSAAVNWTAEGNQADAWFGHSVSTAGDVNGDGYSDAIIGANKYDNGQTDEGRAFVFHGSSSGLSASANWTAESDQASAEFGNSVSSAGDINGDNYSDVIVGAHLYDEAFGTDNGKVFVFFGNGKAGLRTTVQQYKPGTGNVISSGSISDVSGQVRLNIFGKSNFGRADGKILYEYKDNGLPFSGAVITNSTSSSGSGDITDLGTSIKGVQLNKDITGLLQNKVYRWRARVLYSPANNPYQKLGPWKYYNNYMPLPLGNFRPKDPPGIKNLYMYMFIQGFYDPGSYNMVRDTVTVYLRNSSAPYAIVDSSKKYVGSDGFTAFSFSNPVNGVGYYIQLKHRNSIETWSNTPQTFVNNSLQYDFFSANTQAYGNNLVQIDTLPLRYAVYSGDVDQLGQVDLNDVLAVYNDAVSFATGYKVTDLTGDNFTNLSDIVICYNNSVGFVVVSRP